MRPFSGLTPNWMFEPPVSHTHGADDGEALVAHDLKFLVGQRLDGRDGVLSPVWTPMGSKFRWSR